MFDLAADVPMGYLVRKPILTKSTGIFFRKRKMESNTWGKTKYRIICQCANIAVLQKIHMFPKSIF